MDSRSIQRLRLIIRGAVQGVGFRPFIYRLAVEQQLSGWVCNTTSGVLIEVEGSDPALRSFLLKVGTERPVLASIQSLEPTFLDRVGYKGFEIRESQNGKLEAWILPDIATCPDCRNEILDPADRRFRYPFTNCTHCGPRYSMVEGLPYDRANTSMKKFKMCVFCEREYHDPRDRRFHAQPNACPDCGPQLQLWDRSGHVLSQGDEALQQAVAGVLAGQVLALKGLGGFHLIVDASNEQAVQLLRERKQRVAKPFALMFPDLAAVKAICDVAPLEERLLTSPESPIVLLRRRGDGTISEQVAPDNPYLGVMLPYSPLHILLLQDLGRPVVATSGNLAEETICFDEKEALKRLKGLADVFLVHNRPIVRAIDDSVVRVILDKEQVIRRARGYAPLPVLVDQDLAPTLAVGGHLKNCVALAEGKNVFISQHIGDLETAQSFEAFHRVIADLQELYRIRPERVACDLHPDYHSTQVARKLGLPVVPVQHHQAHVLACLAENDVELPALGVSWDGSGFGPDGTVWGGEFLKITEESCERFAHFELFPLPGGETAVREPRRSLIGALYAAFGDKAFDDEKAKFLAGFSAKELAPVRQMLLKNVNSPLTSSVGRRFDAVAALAGLCDKSTFEGQAAMSLEFALPISPSDAAYSFKAIKSKPPVSFVIQAPVWEELLTDVEQKVPADVISAKFHNMLVEIIVWAARESGLERIVLTGGCFQNRYLTERSVTRLRSEGFKAYWHQRVPANDGGIALGQVLAAARGV